MVTKNIKKGYNVILSLLIILLMIACSDNIVPDIIDDNGERIESDELIPIALNLKGLYNKEDAKTYSLKDSIDLPGFGHENDISDVTVYIFNSSYKIEGVLRGNPPLFTPTDTVMVKAGIKNFIAVVNGIGKMPALYNPNLPGFDSTLVTYNGLRNELASTNIGSSTQLPNYPFLMSGEMEKTLSPGMQRPDPNIVDIEVKRSVAKAKIFVTKSSTIGQTLTMKSITLKNGADQVHIIQKPTTPDVVNYTVPSLLKDDFNRVSYPNKSLITTGEKIIPIQGTEYCMLADTFYTYETLCGKDKSKAVYFDLEVNVGSNTRTARVYLAEDASSGDTVYNVYRNNWYEVYINIKNPGVDSVEVTIKSCPWNVADTIPKVEGFGYEVNTSVPFKLVKNYTALDTVTASNKLFMAIKEHTKGASWFELKVTGGALWNLSFLSGEPGNVDAKMSIDKGNTWHSSLSGIGVDNKVDTVYIYRVYKENAEPTTGPKVALEINGQFIRTLVVQPRDITPVPTNSYIMRPRLTPNIPLNETRVYIPLAGVFSYWEDYLLNNGVAIPNGTISAVLREFNPGSIKSGSVNVINANKRDSAYIYAEAGSLPGNAVIDMVVGGSIYWSFHLWVTDYNPYEAAGQKLYAINSSRANVFMDRNLGAIANIGIDVDAYGLYYQFGRKDPFRLLVASSYSSRSTPTASSTFRPLAAIPTQINNPDYYYNGSPSWTFNSENLYLWNTAGGNKTAFDPCPEGWRVPVQSGGDGSDSPWSGLTITNFADNVGFYPLSGYISNAGVFTSTNVSGYYWTSWPGTSATGINSIGLSLTTSSLNLAESMQKNTGRSVRCVVDKSYIQKGGTAFSNSKVLLDNIKP